MTAVIGAGRQGPRGVRRSVARGTPAARRTAGRSRGLDGVRAAAAGTWGAPGAGRVAVGSGAALRGRAAVRARRRPGVALIAGSRAHRPLASHYRRFARGRRVERPSGA
ncbi:hypothetical protein GCM10009660_33380 [Catellatospora bangladeshensis]